MRLSTKGRYAVMAITDLAMHAQGKPISLSEISQRQQISLSYLEQLFARLRKCGLVKSARGPGGGYVLARDAQDVFVADVVLAVDEPIRATRCSMTSNKLGANKRLSKEMAAIEIGCMTGGSRCVTHTLWENLGHAIQDYLSQVSIQDVVDKKTRRPMRSQAHSDMSREAHAHG